MVLCLSMLTWNAYEHAYEVYEARKKREADSRKKIDRVLSADNSFEVPPSPGGGTPPMRRMGGRTASHSLEGSWRCW